MFKKIDFHLPTYRNKRNTKLMFILWQLYNYELDDTEYLQEVIRILEDEVTEKPKKKKNV